MCVKQLKLLWIAENSIAINVGSSISFHRVTHLKSAMALLEGINSRRLVVAVNRNYGSIGFRGLVWWKFGMFYRRTLNENCDFITFICLHSSDIELPVKINGLCK